MQLSGKEPWVQFLVPPAPANRLKMWIEHFSKEDIHIADKEVKRHKYQ